MLVDSVASRFFTPYSLNNHNSADFNSQIAREWIRACKESHPNCSEVQLHESPRLPNRILDVTSGTDSSTIRLHHSHNAEKADYVCLSYAWGGPQPITLSLSSLQEYQDGIRVDELPLTLRDAIYVTRQLGIRYLWIDALCIIQNCDEDKIKELVMMQEYYSNAVLVIQPSGLSSVHEAFLGDARTKPKDPTQIVKELGKECARTLEVPFFSLRGYQDKVTLELDPNVYEPDDEPLAYRGWAFQERLLCHRILIFPGSGGLVWQCEELETSDGKDYSDTINYGTGRTRLPLPPLALSRTGATQMGTYEITESWKEIVNEFAYRELTVPEDKLVALAALAERYSKRYGSLLGAYCAGHWRMILSDTLWWTVRVANRAAPRAKRAPTWSWAAVDHADYRGNPPDDCMIEILQCIIEPKSPELPFGAVKDGRLLLKGMLGNAVWYPNTFKPEDQSDEEDEASWAVEYLLFETPSRSKKICPGLPDTLERIPQFANPCPFNFPT